MQREWAKGVWSGMLLSVPPLDEAQVLPCLPIGFCRLKGTGRLNHTRSLVGCSRHRP